MHSRRVLFLVVSLAAVSVACSASSASDVEAAAESNEALGTARLRLFPSSDSCGGEFIGVGPTAACGSVAGNAWSVQVDGQCIDIVDMPATRACELFRYGLPRGPQLFASSDSCRGASIPIDRYTRCDALSGNAWSILADGECLDIVDTTAALACRDYAYGIPHGPRIYPSSDSCRGSFIPIDRYTRCDSLSAGAWSILVGGECENIVDTSAASACQQWQSGSL